MPSEVATMETIGVNLIDPTQSTIFGKGKKTEHALCITMSCELPECPLRAAGQCVMHGGLGFNACPYGKVQTESGPTGRSGSFRKWLHDRKSDAGWPDYAPVRLAFIGDYVYLPYAHMGMCKDVDFIRHSMFMSSGVPFIRRDVWRIETVLMLIDFRPQAFFGGEITDYQAKSVPRFIQHVREMDPEMWAELIRERPQLDKPPNYIGRKALVRTLAYPITLPPKDGRYPVSWEWDGTCLTTRDKDCYSDTWGGVKAESIEMTIVPRADAAIEVRSNDWVLPTTVFND